jgi:FkbM family methyltransferase
MTTLLQSPRDGLAHLKRRIQLWRQYYWLGEYELKELPNYVRRDRIAVDVGANVGVYAYHLSRLAQRVLAFEPIPDLAAVLRRLNLHNLEIEEAALSDHSGSATLRISDRGMGVASLEAATVPEQSLTRQVEVPVRCLDDYALKDVGFVKIDVEGHEETVIAGAMKTIQRDHPVLLVEIEERFNPGGLERIAGKLEAQGYMGYFFEEGRRRSIAEFDPQLHQKVCDELHAFTNRRKLAFINNFLFVAA